MTIGFPRIRSLWSGLIRFTKCAEEPTNELHLNSQKTTGLLEYSLRGRSFSFEGALYQGWMEKFEPS